MASSLSFLDRLKNRRSRKREEAGLPRPHLPSQDASTVAVATHLASDHDSLSTGERLWNDAYDSLKYQDSELVTAYEKVLSRELAGSGTQSDAIETKDPRKRQAQMEDLVQIGMTKLQGQDARVERAMQSVLGVSSVIGTALQPVPQAALAWVGVSFALQVLVNATTENRSLHEGVSYVAMRMAWYCELSQLLLRENTSSEHLPAELRLRFKDRIFDLYTVLLSYLMKSVCSCHRNRVYRYFQNTLKLNDWEGGLKEIRQAEQLVQHDMTQYSTQQVRLELEELATAAQSRHAQLLANIQKATLDHAAQAASTKRDEADNQLLRQLCLTDPRDDMIRIEQTKDRLLEGSCNWIFDRPDFISWLQGDSCSIYWIKGGPGKGKTMLLIGIIRRMLDRSPHEFLPIFFCQNADPNLNNGTAILRGLMYQLAVQAKSAQSYVREAYETRGQSLFDDANAFFALSKIFLQILEHPGLPKVYIIIDALDECETDLDTLLALLTESVRCSKLRCLVSSRPRSEIRNSLTGSGAYYELDLDGGALTDVKDVVEAYIDHEVESLSQRKNYNVELQEEVRDYLRSHAGDTFLWVALVCKQLRRTRGWETSSVLKTFPAGLDGLYARMIEQVNQLDMDSNTSIYCRQILAAVAIAYRPLTLDELGIVADLPTRLTQNISFLEEIVDLCGNFLTVRQQTVYFVHQSAKEYLSADRDQGIFPDGRAPVHSGIVLRGLKSMSRTLQKDIWNLRAPDRSLNRLERPDPDPLGRVAYMCVYWIDHIVELSAETQQQLGLCDSGAIDVFIREHFLHWLEALSLLQSLRAGEECVTKLVQAVEQGGYTSVLCLILHDAKYFVEHHRRMIESAPLQLYSSAVLFSPTSSRIRHLFEDQVPSWLTGRPLMEENWNLRLHALTEEGSWKPSIAFFADGQFLAAARTHRAEIEIWNTKTRTIENVLTGHYDVRAIAVSPDQAKLASGSSNGTVDVWDLSTGELSQTFDASDYRVYLLAFSSDSSLVASGFDDGTVRVWNVQTGTAQGDFTTGLVDDVRSFAFIANRDLVLGGLDGNLRVWDAETGKVETVLELKIGMIFSVAVMADEASATICAQRGVQVWDFKSKRLLRELVRSVPGFRAFLAFSSNDTYLVAGPYDGVIQLWDSATGTIQGTIRFDHYVWSMAISSDGRKVAISTTARVYLWNADVQPFATALTHLKSRITTVKVSHCQQWIATGANDGTLGVWDRKTGSIVRILRGHNNNVHSVVISRSGSRLLSGSMEQIRIWEVATWTTMRVLESGSRVVGLALSIDEKKVFSATEDGTICIWDADTGVLIKSTNTQTTPVSLTSFSPDGQLVSWAYSGKVETRSIETGELVQIHSRGRPYVGDLALSPNGQHLAIGSMGDIITIRQVQTNILQQTVRGASRKIDFGDDGSTIITNKARIALDWSLPQGSKADANWQGYGVDKNGEWVTWNGRRLLRLPAECSYGESAVTDQFIVLPYEATRIIILEFAEGVNPFRDR